MFKFGKPKATALDLELGKVREANASALEGLLGEIHGLLHQKPAAPVIPLEQPPRIAHQRRAL